MILGLLFFVRPPSLVLDLAFRTTLSKTVLRVLFAAREIVAAAPPAADDAAKSHESAERSQFVPTNS